MAAGGVGIETSDDPGRDDAGRRDDSPGFDIQARIFAIVGTFFAAIAVLYWFVSYESAGTVMLSLASGLAFTIGAYLGWKKPPPHTSVDEAEPPGEEEPWFPSASGWPFALGGALVLVANGLLLGLWLLLPAAALLAYALAGFIQQSRVRG
jgi:cytochrome c oxidase subunit IV